jgi:predicted DNA-binding transcriptional regulator YafY
MSGAIVPIRRADRLFDILRILRSAKAPVTAASIADELEVTSFISLPVLASTARNRRRMRLTIARIITDVGHHVFKCERSTI